MSVDNTFSFDKAEDSSGFLLWQVTNLWQRQLRKALEPHGITHSQYVLLASTHWLSLSGAVVTQVLLSQHTKIDPMTTSTVLRTLQDKGYVQRAEHPTDTRAKIITLTVAGKEVVKKAVVTVEQFDSEFFSTLGMRTGTFNSLLLSLLPNVDDNE
jgi:DNA-binding MarR family transcriptional regulator